MHDMSQTVTNPFLIGFFKLRLKGIDHLQYVVEQDFPIPELPVLTTALIAVATWPFSRELSSFTSSIRQLHNTKREQARRIRPTAKSDREQSTKRCLPGHTDRSTVNEGEGHR